MARTKKWVEPPIHPAADKLPMMSKAELKELTEDIKANGLQEPIAVWEDNTEAANGAKGPFPVYMLDGRNRMAALKQLGIADPRHAKLARPAGAGSVRYLTAMVESTVLGSNGTSWQVDTDPIAYVLSANVRRRHLTSEQKQASIHAILDVAATWSNREIARAVGVSDHTVAKVRKSGRNAQNAQSDHLPLERAKKALRDDPTLSTRAIAEKAKVGQTTVKKARRELEEAGEITSRTAATSKAKAKPKAKKRQKISVNYDLVVKRMTREVSKIGRDLEAIINEVNLDEVTPQALEAFDAEVDEFAKKLKAAARRHNTNAGRK